MTVAELDELMRWLIWYHINYLDGTHVLYEAVKELHGTFCELPVEGGKSLGDIFTYLARLKCVTNEDMQEIRQELEKGFRSLKVILKRP